MKMQPIRIVWKDSGKTRIQKPIKYRGHTAEGVGGNGWVIDIPGDNNVYHTHYCALNAIDAALGGHGQMGSAKRQKYGIKIQRQK